MDLRSFLTPILQFATKNYYYSVEIIYYGVTDLFLHENSNSIR